MTHASAAALLTTTSSAVRPEGKDSSTVLTYGGTDADAMRAMGGWVVEAPPFTGTGFVPMTVPPIQEYKLDSIRLPHRAEIFRIDRDAEEILIAIYDADRDGWLLVDHEGAER